MDSFVGRSPVLCVLEDDVGNLAGCGNRRSLYTVCLSVCLERVRRNRHEKKEWKKTEKGENILRNPGTCAV